MTDPRPKRGRGRVWGAGLAGALLLAAIAVILLLALRDGDDDAREEVRSAARTTQRAGAAEVGLAISSEAPGLAGLGGPLTLDGKGEIDPAAGAARYELGVSGVPVAEDFGVDEVEVVIDGDSLFARIPAGAGGLPGGAEWILIDLDRAADELGLDLGALVSSGDGGADDLLAQLRALDEVERVGDETVNGIATTLYQGEISFEELPASLPRSQRDDARREIERLLELGTEPRVPTSVWVDRQGLVRRIEQETSFPVASTGFAEVSQTVEFLDFGIDADIEPPPPDAVVDLTDLAAEGLDEEGLTVGGD